MNLYSMCCNCVHYVGTMGKPFISGMNWTDIEAVARMSGIPIDTLMMKRLRKIESLVIKESISNGSD